MKFLSLLVLVNLLLACIESPVKQDAYVLQRERWAKCVDRLIAKFEYTEFSQQSEKERFKIAEAVCEEIYHKRGDDEIF